MVHAGLLVHADDLGLHRVRLLLLRLGRLDQLARCLQLFQNPKTQLAQAFLGLLLRAAPVLDAQLAAQELRVRPPPLRAVARELEVRSRDAERLVLLVQLDGVL